MFTNEPALCPTRPDTSNKLTAEFAEPSQTYFTIVLWLTSVIVCAVTAILSPSGEDPLLFGTIPHNYLGDKYGSGRWI